MGAEPEISWRHCDRIEPGVYPAYSRAAKVYRDRYFKRWVCAVQFDVMSESLTEVVAQVTWYLNLGSSERPHVGRRGNYWQAWVRANAGLPQRKDRLSPRIFIGRHARIAVANTTCDFRGVVSPQHEYTVVRDVVRWDTGGTSK